jgi:ribosomal-protein-alanine N-acetyltransferase
MSVVPRLHTARLSIRLAESVDAARLLHYRVENREHLAPWEPLRDSHFFTLDHCLQSIAEGREAVRLDRGYSLLVFDRGEDAVLAIIHFANVVRGAFQACHLGYGVAASRQSQGLMHEALVCGLTWAFGDLGLHRVMANYMPGNERSARLLERLGFEREGYARHYLRIAGAWEDHVLTAKVAPA